MDVAVLSVLRVPLLLLPSHAWTIYLFHIRYLLFSGTLLCSAAEALPPCQESSGCAADGAALLGKWL